MSAEVDAAQADQRGQRREQVLAAGYTSPASGPAVAEAPLDFATGLCSAFAPLAVPHALVVDDDQAVRELVTDILCLDGFTVAAARDGAQALEAVRRQRPDVVVLDLMMPVMDGHAFLRTFRQVGDWASIPVVVVSDVASEIERAAHLAHARLSKPFDVDELLLVVWRVISA